MLSDVLFLSCYYSSLLYHWCSLMLNTQILIQIILKNLYTKIAFSKCNDSYVRFWSNRNINKYMKYDTRNTIDPSHNVDFSVVQSYSAVSTWASNIIAIVCMYVKICICTIWNASGIHFQQCCIRAPTTSKTKVQSRSSLRKNDDHGTAAPSTAESIVLTKRS